ncbi:MAG: integrin alpha [Myxococcota bacterium]
MQRAIAEREYYANQGARGLQAPNRRHRFRSYFDGAGVRVVDRTSADEPLLLALSTEAFGREDGLAPVARGIPSGQAGRVELARSESLVEWFENAASGLEHGYTLGEAPGGEGELVFRVAVEGARAIARGDALVFASSLGRRLRYAKLVATDADGRMLPARMVSTVGSQFELRVDDAGARYPIVIDPLLTAEFDTALESNQVSAQMGTCVSPAGDVNGDGYADVLVGAPLYDLGHADEGAAFVFHGGPGGLADGNPLNAAAVLQSNQNASRFGFQCDSAGDVNGDGYDDVIVGAYLFGSGFADEGTAYVFHGGPSGIGDGDPSTADAVLLGGQASAFFGRDVAGAGDVNGDGYADVIVGATDWDGGQSNEGAVFVFHGSASGIGSRSASAADATIQGEQAGASMGRSVDSAGDVNGDGYDDVIVGGWELDLGEVDEGAVFLFHGSPTGITSGTTLDADSTIEGNLAGMGLGFRAAGAGDVNGDGYADVIVGAHLYPQTHAGNGGAAFVFHGGATGVASGGAVAAADAFIDGNAYLFGYSVASAGDVNGDGYADVIVGAYQTPKSLLGTDVGAAFVYLGSAAGVTGSSAFEAWVRLEADQAGAQLGFQVASAGDVDGDGLDDVIVGARLYDGPQADEGTAFVYSGRALGLGLQLASDAATTLESGQADAMLGSSVASAGDVNGDGYSDVLVGAPLYDAGELDEGAAFLFLGGPNGIPDGGPGTVDAFFESDQEGAQFGLEIAGLGDVNGDGFGDIAIGTRFWSASPGGIEGLVAVFHGSALGLADGSPTTADAIFEGSDDVLQLGACLAGPGDLNGDGFADLLVGASPYPGADLAFAFHGGPGGLGSGTELAADTRIGAPLLLGDPSWSACAGAGDVNGDGYADVLVSFPELDVSNPGAGAVWIFHGGAGGIPNGTIAEAETEIFGEVANSFLGISVASAGDRNGDGFDDVAISSRTGGLDQAVLLFDGSAPGIVSGGETTRNSQISFGGIGTSLGYSIAALGDLEGDGFDDLLVGAPAFLNRGAAFVYSGEATPPSFIPGEPSSYVLDGTRLGAGFGAAVALAGDVNGDGFPDVVVGAPAREIGSPVLEDGGTASIFLGNDNVPGRPVRPAQLRGDGSDLRVPPGGLSHSSDGFRVEIDGTSPRGRELGRLEVEVCPYGTPFGDAGCTTVLDTEWVLLGGSGVRFGRTVTGLVDGALYDWRARVHYEDWSPLGSGFLPTQRVGPWWRIPHSVTPGDIRVPEPGLGIGLVVSVLGLAVSRRARRVGSDARRDARSTTARRASTRVLMVASVVASGLLGSACSTPDRADREAAPKAPIASSQADADLAAGWSDLAISAIASREYHASATSRGLQAPNRRHGFRTFFDGEGIRVVDRVVGQPGDDPHPILRLDTRAFGRAAQNREVLAGAVRHAAERVEIDRGDGLVEWFVNSRAGLEHGYAIETPPPGEGDVLLRLAVGDARVVAQGDDLLFVSSEAHRLRYSKLVATDADGRVLLARLVAATESEIEIRVDDEGARYPIEIDPILTNAFEAEFESNQVSASMGICVGSAGDVNGDTYADVIVGAYLYDLGEADEGAAFVFHGGPGGPSNGNPLDADAVLQANQGASRFGFQCDSAGDVNGDGYDDVLVGAYLYDSTLSGEGAAFVFHGGPAGIGDRDPSNADAVLLGEQANALFGRDVAGAGDVNADGFDDVIVGATDWDGGQSNEGAAFVFHGSASGIGSRGASAADARIEGEQASAALGRSVDSAGDLNHDGHDDVIIGAHLYDLGEVDEGAVFVFHGGPGGIATGTALDADAIIESNFSGAQLGFRAAGAGDVNGDGYDDVVVGAHAFSVFVNTVGKAFVFHGGPTGIAATATPANADRVINGSPGANAFGYSVAPAGDVNGDGFDDIIAGDPEDSTDTGVAFVFLGSANGVTASSASVAHAELSTGQAGSQFGFQVAGAGDVDGDGLDDVIVGARFHDGPQTDEGTAFVYTGGLVGFGRQTANQAATTLEGGQGDALLGYSVASAGDVNGDGYGDVIVGAPDYDAGQADEGAALVFLGGPNGIPDGGPGTVHAFFESNQVGARFGESVAGLGDVNGDGYGDIAIAAPQWDSDSIVGRGLVAVYYGSALGLADGSPFDADTMVEGAGQSDRLGSCLAAAGDVDGDGYADMLAGRYFVNSVLDVFAGGPVGLDAIPETTISIDGSTLSSGLRCSGAGDVNGDGYADVMLSHSNLNSPGLNLNGGIWVFHGGPTGVASGGLGIADATLIGAEEFGQLGRAISSAGDWNGDGYDDIAAYTAQGAGTAAVVIFEGSPTGIPSGSETAASTRIERTGASIGFGQALAAAGDEDGDGYEDLLVGGSDTEAAYGYAGSATPPGVIPWTSYHDFFINDRPGEMFGASVASAGDVNGDGFADVVVGAPRRSFDTAELLDMGTASIFLGNGNQPGRPVRPAQLRSDDSDRVVPPGGLSHSSDGFRVELTGFEPANPYAGRLEVEVCPYGTSFGDVGCSTYLDESWASLSASGTRFQRDITGLVDGALYDWRARVHYGVIPGAAGSFVATKHIGPWWRIPHSVTPGDIRVPEPGFGLGLSIGLLALLRAARRSHRRDDRPDRQRIRRS